MNPAYSIYNLLGKILFLTIFPGFRLYSELRKRNTDSLDQRFGLYSRFLVSQVTGSPRIWIHAASVGEVTVAAAIINSLVELIPECAVIASTSTEHGQAYLKTKSCPQTTCVYAPIDLPAAVSRALNSFKPDILVCLETEIWPNWLKIAQKTGIKTAIINGRISSRSSHKYLKIRPLIKDVLVGVDAFSMIHPLDAQRIKALGAPDNKIQINGNAKYDLLCSQVDHALKEDIQSKFRVQDGDPVFIAGSTRGPEEGIVLAAFQKIFRSIPETLLILAPRHISRVPQIEALVKEKGFKYQLKTDLDNKDSRRTAPIVILNTMGELHAIYSIASVVFCGGSLAPLGGHNVLEAAVWGKPVLYGESMEDFIDAKNLLEKAGGGIQIKDGTDLSEKVTYLLQHPAEADKLGALARNVITSNRDAAKKHAEVIYRLLIKRSSI